MKAETFPNITKNFMLSKSSLHNELLTTLEMNMLLLRKKNRSLGTVYETAGVMKKSLKRINSDSYHHHHQILWQLGPDSLPSICHLSFSSTQLVPMLGLKKNLVCYLDPSSESQQQASLQKVEECHINKSLNLFLKGFNYLYKDLLALVRNWIRTNWGLRNLNGFKFLFDGNFIIRT